MGSPSASSPTVPAPRRQPSHASSEEHVSPTVDTLHDTARPDGRGTRPRRRADRLRPRPHAERQQPRGSTVEDRIERQAAWGRSVRGAPSVPSRAWFDPLPMLEVLGRHRVDFVVVGGVAGGAHGSSYPTYDLDIAYARDAGNLERLAAALRELQCDLARRAVRCSLSARRRDTRARCELHVHHEVREVSMCSRTSTGRLRTRRSRRRERWRMFAACAIVVASLDHLIAMKEAAVGARRTS